MLPPDWIYGIQYWIRVLITVVCLGAPGIMYMPESWKAWLWRRLRFRLPAFGWEQLAIAAICVCSIQLVVLNADRITGVVSGWGSWWMSALAEQHAAAWKRAAPLLTQPVCESNCDNFDFLVRECERQAVQVGGLALPVGRDRRPIGYGDIEGATAYFRGCLVDKGVAWKPCKRGDPGCRLLRSFSTRRSSALPSFIVR